MHFGIIINISIAAGSSGYALVLYILYIFYILIKNNFEINYDN